MKLCVVCACSCLYACWVTPAFVTASHTAQRPINQNPPIAIPISSTLKSIRCSARNARKMMKWRIEHERGEESSHPQQQRGLRWHSEYDRAKPIYNYNVRVNPYGSGAWFNACCSRSLSLLFCNQIPSLSFFLSSHMQCHSVRIHGVWIRRPPPSARNDKVIE